MTGNSRFSGLTYQKASLARKEGLQWGKAKRTCSGGGFTLIELSIVLAILGILYALAVPVVSRNLKMAKEAALKEDLRSLRKAIDAYRTDFRRYPAGLFSLVEKGYIYKTPVDPFTRSPDTWQISEISESDSGFERGIVDVHSGSDEVALNGEAVSTW